MDRLSQHEYDEYDESIVKLLNLDQDIIHGKSRYFGLLIKDLDQRNYCMSY